MHSEDFPAQKNYAICGKWPELEKEAANLRENNEGDWGGFRRRRWKESNDLVRV